MDVDHQIELLLHSANGDAATLPGIRRVSLMCLGSLARKSIDFSPDHIKVRTSELWSMGTLELPIGTIQLTSLLPLDDLYNCPRVSR